MRITDSIERNPLPDSVSSASFCVVTSCVGGCVAVERVELFTSNSTAPFSTLSRKSGENKSGLDPTTMRSVAAILFFTKFELASLFVDSGTVIVTLTTRVGKNSYFRKNNLNLKKMENFKNFQSFHTEQANTPSLIFIQYYLL